MKLPASRTDDILQFLADEASTLVHDARPIDADVDKADALVLGEALAGNAELFVTGDAALLRLGAVDGVNIVSPRVFWDTLHARNG